MTSAVSPESLLQAARECAEMAGAVALAHYRKKVAVETKGDGSPVTIADRQAERVARTWLRSRFPGDGLMGEEFGEEAGTSGRRWVVDPIDGTKSFVRGVPLWGSLVAVADGNRVLAGAASFPATGEVVAAATGCGCWYNDVRARVSDVSDLGRATVLVTDDRTFRTPDLHEQWRRLAHAAGISRGWGDAFGYLLVATGRAEVMVDPVANPWDVACFVPIIEEAGGVFTDLTGAVTAFGGHAVATNAALAAETRGILCST